MSFDEAFKDFKDKYLSTPRVVNIIPNEFGSDDITILFYDKYDKTPPIVINSWNGYPVDSCGMIALRDMWEKLFDLFVLNDPSSWDFEVKFSHNYKIICKQIAEYELKKGLV